MTNYNLQFITDENGNKTSVVIPINLWREIESERETAYLLKSKTMKKRLIEAKKRADGISLEQVREKLGI
jgi:PHD/YefM family antitoxin component YafN of YafNO toxin-antitoxin module